MKFPAFKGGRQVKKPKSTSRQETGLGKDRKSNSRKPKIKISPISRWHPRMRQIVDFCIIFISVSLCLLLLPSRLPGMELLDIAPNWLLIWVVAWSVKRPAIQGLLAGVVLGLLQDAMTSPNPTHALSLGLVGFITSLLQKQRFIQEDFISIALIVFGMVVFSESVFAAQLTFMGTNNVDDVWSYHQKVSLASAILSSLWAPVVYYPLNQWWQRLKIVEQQS
jgi:rod shape-determining protein MreD